MTIAAALSALTQRKGSSDTMVTMPVGDSLPLLEARETELYSRRQAAMNHARMNWQGNMDMVEACYDFCTAEVNAYTHALTPLRKKIARLRDLPNTAIVSISEHDLYNTTPGRS